MSSLFHESSRLEWPVDANIVLYEWVESCYMPRVSLSKSCVLRLSFVHACIRAPVISRQVRAYTWSMFGEFTFPTVCITDLFAFSSNARMISSRDRTYRCLLLLPRSRCLRRFFVLSKIILDYVINLILHSIVIIVYAIALQSKRSCNY